MIDFFDDAIGVGGPDEGSGFAVVLAEIAIDRRLQIDERMEDAALQSSAGEQWGRPRPWAGDDQTITLARETDAPRRRPGDGVFLLPKRGTARSGLLVGSRYDIRLGGRRGHVAGADGPSIPVLWLAVRRLPAARHV
jgi:hypothetical protein